MTLSSYCLSYKRRSILVALASWFPVGSPIGSKEGHVTRGFRVTPELCKTYTQYSGKVLAVANHIIHPQRFFSISKQAFLQPGRETRSLDRSYSFLDYNRIYGSTYVSEPKNGPGRLPIGTVCAWIESNFHRLGDRPCETECQFWSVDWKCSFIDIFRTDLPAISDM